MSRHFLLHGIFSTQGLDPCLLHCRKILYHLSHQGRPFLKNNFIYLFLAVPGLCCCVGGLSSSCSQWGLLSSCQGWVFCCGGFSCCRAWALGHAGFRSSGTQAQWLQFTDCRVWVQKLWHRSLVALCHVESTRVGRWILYHWATREAPALPFRRGLWKGIRWVKRNLVCLPTDEPKYHRRWAVLLNAISGLVCAWEITSGASDHSSVILFLQASALLITGVCLVQARKAKCWGTNAYGSILKTMSAGRWWSNASLRDITEVCGTLPDWPHIP